MMRIITGRAKGIRLKTLEGDATRPTAERVKEAVFSMLQGDIEDRYVLDLFSGSGQMALEALSRGASYAALVDKSAEAVRIIRENIQKARLEEFCDVYREDFTSYIHRNAGRKFDIVFLDPPYASGYYVPALRALTEKGMLKPTTLIVCESGTDNVFENDALSEKFETVKQARYGRSYITIISPKGGDGE